MKLMNKFKARNPNQDIIKMFLDEMLQYYIHEVIYPHNL